MRKMTIVLLLVASCSSPEETIEAKLKELTIKELVNSLKSPDSYKPGGFRYKSMLGNQEFPGIKKSIYMKPTFEMMGRDTIYDGRYVVIHMYTSKNGFGADIKGMVEVIYDSHLRFLAMGEWTESDEANEVKRFKEAGKQVEPLRWAP